MSRPRGVPTIGLAWSRGGGIEIAVRHADGTQVEVGLDRRLRILEIEREDPADE